MKIKIIIIGVAALLATVFQAPAQGPISGSYAAITIPFSYNNGGAAATTSNTVYGATNAPTIGALKQRYIAVGGEISCSAVGGTNTYTFAPSVNGIDMDTNVAANLRTFAVFTTGNIPTYMSTNWDTLGYPYYRLWVVATTGVVTNGIGTNGVSRNSLEYAVKISSP